MRQMAFFFKVYLLATMDFRLEIIILSFTSALYLKMPMHSTLETTVFVESDSAGSTYNCSMKWNQSLAPRKEFAKLLTFKPRGSSQKR